MDARDVDIVLGFKDEGDAFWVEQFKQWGVR